MSRAPEEVEGHPREVPDAAGGARSMRVLVCTAFPRDAVLAAECLSEAGVSAFHCATNEALVAELERGAGAVILSDDRLTPALVGPLRAYLDRQPAWSDLPLVVMVADSSVVESILDALEPLGNISTIERPTRRTALVSATKAALRARVRQYETRALLERLAGADRRKDAFIAMLGHELRNPLAAIHGAATILDAVPDKGERLMRVSTILGRQVTHLERLLDDLLDVARITAGKITLKRERVDVPTMARQVVSMLDQLARARGHELELAVPDATAWVDADPVRFEQMLGNLVQNAIKYTPDGGSIRVAVDIDDGVARVRVKDNGYGLTPDAITHVFEPFAQVDSSLDRTMGGLGLGLPLVRGIARLHGGTVEAHSDGLGLGAEFVLCLPLVAVASERSPADSAPQPSDDGARGGLHVLLVDDFPDVLDVLRLGLEARGCIVDTATDGAQALERARTGAYDVAFVDIGLPGIDGFEVARRVRAESDVLLPLIAMSGYGRTEDRSRSAAAGFDQHLVKPVDPEQLIRAAMEVLADRATAQPAG